jgi:hypothetical protein
MVLAGCLLIASALSIITIARYEALRQDIEDTCPSAAALDLTSWIPICKRVGYREMVYIQPEDLDR